MKITLTELLTLLGLLVAFLTWLLTHLKSRKDQKITNTVQIINNLSTVKHLLDADLKIRKELRTIKELKADSIDQNIEENLVVLLDYYEFLARLYWSDAVDKASLEHLRGGLICETYQASRGYIEHWRDELQRPDLYKQLEMLSNEMASN